MSPLGQEPDQLRDFTGRVPLFPLPDTVLFPHVLLPLVIFEPRYREMVFDALVGDGLIAMALLESGWEETYETKAARIHSMICLSQIKSSELLPDGRYQVVLEGLARGLVLDEETSSRPYRVGRVELCPGMPSTLSSRERLKRQRELLVGFQQLAVGCEFDSVFHNSLDADLPLGGLCDVLAHSMPISPDAAQSILEESDVAVRAELVLDELRSCIGAHAGRPTSFPPPYSLN
ncbi:MAG: LON peptidase substrate-binding domain-containing protein [Planctomycetaceae bacterium]